MSTGDIDIQIYGMAFAGLVLALLTIIVVVVIWQGAASWRAMKLASRDEAYRKLAESMADTMRELSEGQAAARNDLADLRARGERIEQLLRQVE